MKFRWVYTWDPGDRRLRLCRFIWTRGDGPGAGAPSNYSAMLSLSIDVVRWADSWIGMFCRGARDEWWAWLCILPWFPLRLHYQRAYGGHHS